MNLKNKLVAGIAAITLFTAGAAVISSHQGHVAVVQAAKEGKKQKDKYQKWIKKVPTGNVAAKRTTKMTTSKNLGKASIFDNHPSKTLRKGEALGLWKEIKGKGYHHYNKLTYQKGHYYLNWVRNDSNGYYWCKVRCADLVYKPWNMKTWHKYSRWIMKISDVANFVHFTPNKNITGYNYQNKKHVLRKGKAVRLQQPLLVRNLKGDYIMTFEKYYEYGYQVPIKNMTKVKVQKYTFMGLGNKK